jgi:uncharacterized protein
MKNTTDQFSFILKPSKYGIGIFTTHDIAKDTPLRLFGNEQEHEHNSTVLKKSQIPEIFRGYCINMGKEMICPQDFGVMPIGWFINHSEDPNIYHKNLKWFALRNINNGEELLADYNSLGEPESEKEEYYKK